MYVVYVYKSKNNHKIKDVDMDMKWARKKLGVVEGGELPTDGKTCVRRNGLGKINESCARGGERWVATGSKKRKYCQSHMGSQVIQLSFGVVERVNIHCIKA